MKKKLFLITSALFAVALLSWSFCPSSHYEAVSESPSAKAAVPATSDGFALVELFTSQGCSSCPPADRLLSELARKNENIIALSFHVDYWDYLGWKDPFSQKKFTERQYKYAKLLHSQVYTPQMVVNGKTEFVGPQKANAYHFTQKAISKTQKGEMKTVANLCGEQICVALENLPEMANVAVNVALVQKSATIAVKKGENGGRTLHHNNVVRSLKVLDGKSKEVSFEMPSDLIAENAYVVAYAQDKNSWQVVDAVKVDIGTNK